MLAVKVILGTVIGIVAGAIAGYFGKCSSGACPLTANPFRGAIYGAVLGTLFAYAFFANAPQPIPEGMQPSPGEGLADITSQAAFIQYTSVTGMPCLVDFHSIDHPACRELEPVIQELAEKYRRRAVVCKVDTETLPELVNAYGIGAVPAVLFFRDGKEVERMVGLRPQKAYERILDKMLE